MSANLREIDQYDKSILLMPQGKWYRFDSVPNESLLRYLIGEYNRLGLIEFSLSNDMSEFRKVSVSDEIVQFLNKKLNKNENVKH